MAELSEDPGSATSGTSYGVTPDAGLVPAFKEASLRAVLRAGWESAVPVLHPSAAARRGGRPLSTR